MLDMKRFFHNHPLACVFLFTLICLAPVMIFRDFTPANELRYLSIADEAIANGHLFAFSNHGIPYADKPPLYFWCLMLCRLIFGKHCMFILSLFSLIPAFVIIGVMDRWVLKGRSPLTRSASAMMLMTTAMFLALTVYVRMDMMMAMFIVLALRAFWQEKYALFGLFTFLALFTKGPVGLLVPPLAVILDMLVSGRKRDLGKVFNWPFWAILVGASLLWMLGAWLEGGTEYVSNLLFHQTFDRAINAFRHKAPVWFYLFVVWGIAAPWCLLTLPALVPAIFQKKRGLEDPLFHRSGLTRFFVWTILTVFVLLSLFSSKLAIYLLPMLPFLPYLFVRVERKIGWRHWMRVVMSFIACLYAAIAVAAVLSFFFFDRLPLSSEYSFARTPLLFLVAVILLGGSIYAFVRLRQDWKRPVLGLGIALLSSILVLSPLLPEVNKVIGYRQLSEDVLSTKPEGDICALGIYRPENMDVYLNHKVYILNPRVFASNPSLLPADATVILSKKSDAAASYRYSGILRNSGRTCSVSSGLYEIWQ